MGVTERIRDIISGLRPQAVRMKNGYNSETVQDSA